MPKLSRTYGSASSAPLPEVGGLIWAAYSSFSLENLVYASYCKRVSCCGCAAFPWGSIGDFNASTLIGPLFCALKRTPIVLLGVIGEKSATFFTKPCTFPFEVSTVRPAGRREAVPLGLVPSIGPPPRLVLNLVSFRRLVPWALPALSLLGFSSTSSSISPSCCC